MQLCLGKLAARQRNDRQTLKLCISPRQDSEKSSWSESPAKTRGGNTNFLYTAESLEECVDGITDSNCKKPTLVQLALIRATEDPIFRVKEDFLSKKTSWCLKLHSDFTVGLQKKQKIWSSQC